MPEQSEIDKFTLTIDKLQVNLNVQFNSLLRFQKDEIYGLYQRDLTKTGIGPLSHLM